MPSEYIYKNPIQKKIYNSIGCQIVYQWYSQNPLNCQWIEIALSFHGELDQQAYLTETEIKLNNQKTNKKWCASINTHMSGLDLNDTPVSSWAISGFVLCLLCLLSAGF